MVELIFFIIAIIMIIISLQIKKPLLKWFFIVIFLVFLFLLFISKNGFLWHYLDQKEFPIDKNIGIIIKNNQPCFYIDDEIENIEKYKITGMDVEDKSAVDFRFHTLQWFTSERMKPISFEMMNSQDECIIYGDEKLTDEQNKSQELKENTLYSVGFGDNSNTNDFIGFSFYKLFKLHKNSSTGKMEVAIVDN
ncbi:MAG: hypothetical protein KN64_08980 [Sulfurovum sp. AS07-7]|jgi:hypothetical protein|nr:MAG: hypothetical protein KN64_08980 [Sulfurovum sp. AS07-7]TQV63282.1 MAG: hypothetical protein FNT15_04205 [Sulfurovum sp.]